MRKRITKSTVDGIKPKAKEIICWDDLLPGFGIRVKSTGRKYYVLKCRVGGKQRWLRIGKHGAITPDQARQRVREKLDQLERGKVPGLEAPRTVADLCERYSEDHLSKLKLWSRRCYTSAITKYILPELGKVPIQEVRHQEVLRLHNKLRATPSAANRVRSTLSSIFTYAVLSEWLEDNPCSRVKPNREEGRERYLSTVETQRLFRVLGKHHNDMPSTVAAIRLLIYTGARKSEITDLKWDYVDLEDRCLRLPDSKTGRKRILLNDDAIEVLNQIPRTGTNVIEGVGGGRMWLQRPWMKLRKEAGLDDVRLHDLRHNFASAAVSSGLSLPVIGKLLGHKDIKTTARYSHLYDDTLREAANTIGAKLSAKKR